MKRTLAVVVAALAIVVVATTGRTQTPPTYKATLTWVDNSTNEDGFRIERATVAGSGPGPFSQVGQVAANVLSFVDQPLVAGTSYCWRVIAFNAAGASAPSPQACGTVPAIPNSPSGLQIIISIAP